MATRIVDLDRGNLSPYPGNYDQYLLEKRRRRVEELQNGGI